jgi:hypothetical protein
MDWIALIQGFGVPVAILCAIGYAIARSASFLGPKITEITEAHLELITTLNKQAPVQTQLMESQNSILRENSQLLKEIHRDVVLAQREARTNRGEA